MADLRDIRTWRKKLGLLPVPMFGAADRNAYVLLNGNRGSFCLYLDRQSPAHDSRSEAWSANVGHSVNLHEDLIYVQRWDQLPLAALQGLRVSEVSADLEGFHRSLEIAAPPSELSIVAHAVRVFRTLRATLGRNFDGSTALQVFLFLVAAAIDRVDRREVSLNQWRLTQESRRAALTIEEATWETIVTDLLRGSQLHNLKADLTLTLRHASGMLFQEAHYAAIFDPIDQLSFPGYTPPPVSVQSTSSVTGLHFTPPAIARSIVEEALIARGGGLPDNLTIFDPACGSGEFLREALRQLQLREFPGRVRLVGFDVSPAACAMAEFTLAWESRDIAGRVHVEIVRCNALDSTAQWPDNVDIILMNPPFQSWQDMAPELREGVRRELGDLYNYRPDLSAVFLWKSLASLAIDGILGTILPALFLEGNAFRGLRDKVAERLNTVVVARLGSHSLFYAALVDACFYIGRRGVPRGAPLALWASHRPHSTSAALRTLRRVRALEGSIISPVQDDAEGFSFYPNSDLGKKGVSWAPRPYREWKLARRVKDLPTVGDRFRVKQGALTGLNRVFLLTKAEWLQLSDQERPFFRPAVFHESLRGGRFYDEAYVFYPYGAYAIKVESELRNLVPTYYREKLEANKADLLARHGVDPDHWWLLARPREEWQAKPLTKIVTAYFGDSGSFAWDAEGSVVVVQGYSWVPKAKRGLRRQLWLAYLALLNSDIFSSLLAAHSHHVSGGQWNLSKRYIEPMPLPDLDATAIGNELRRTLAELGALIHSSGLDTLNKSDLVRLRELAEAAYFLGGVEQTNGEKTTGG